MKWDQSVIVCSPAELNQTDLETTICLTHLTYGIYSVVWETLWLSWKLNIKSH